MKNWEEKSLAAARWLFLLYVVSLPLVQPFSRRYYGYLFVYSDFVFAASTGSLLLAVTLGKRPIKGHRVFIWVVLFLVSMGASAAMSQEPGRSFLKLSGVTYLAAVAWVTFQLAESESFVRSITMAWLAGTALTVLGAGMGIVGYYLGFDSVASNKFLFHYGSLPAGHYPRIDSFFDNANMMSNYLNVSVVLALTAGYSGWLTKKLAYGLAFLIFGASFFSFSAGVGGLVLSASVFLAFGPFREPSRTQTILLAAGISIAILALASTLVSPIMRENQNTIRLPLLNARLELSSRVVVWENVVVRGLEYPILGRGLGTDAADVVYSAVSGQRLILRDAHQAWLNIFGQSGLIGVISFSFLCWSLFNTCKFDTDLSPDGSWMHLAFSSSFIGAFLFQNLFGSFEDARHLWVLIGLIPASWPPVER